MGPKATLNTNLVQLAELAPQHLGLEVWRVSGRCTWWHFDGFTEVTQQSLDVVSFDDAEEWSKDHDERAQFESAAVVLQPLLGVAVGALLNVDLERAFEKLSPGAIPRAMGGRMLTVSM